MKLSRLLGIIVLLSSKKKMTAAQLASRFDVSVRTIIRDMQTIEEAGIPIVSYQGYEGGYGLVEGYELEKTILSVEDAKWMITILKSMEQMLENPSLKPLIDKMENLQGQQEEVLFWDPLSWTESKKNKLLIQSLYQAIMNHQLIEIVYLDRRGNQTKRLVEPLCLSIKMNTWYLYAFCRLRRDFRLFKILRIEDISSKDCYFVPKEFNQANIFKTEIQETVHLELVFDASYEEYLDGYFDPNDYIGIQEGKIEIWVDYPEDEWLYTWLLGFGEHVYIKGPIKVREELLERVERIKSNYKK